MILFGDVTPTPSSEALAVGLQQVGVVARRAHMGYGT